MRVLLLIFSWGLLMGADAIERPRIVSTSLCGDSYVLSMFTVEDIAALSWQSGDTLSTAPESFKDKPKAHDDIETLLVLNPTLVVFGPGEGGAAKPLLDKAGIRYVSLQWGEDFETVTANQAILDQEIQGQKIRGIKTPAPLPPAQNFPARKNIKILYLSTSGGTAGPGTYVDAAIKRAGGHNIVTTQGWHTPDIETLVGLEPDLIITSFFKDGYASVNQTGLRNKVLQNKLKTTPHVNVPGKLWPCAGPGLYEVTSIIAHAIEGLE